MKAVFKKYLWLWEFIGAALILGVGLASWLETSIVLFVVGCAFVVMGVLRIVPLMRTTFDKLLKGIYFIEIVISVTIGVLLLVLALDDEPQEMQALFGYLIGSVLYLRGAIFFFATTLRKEESDKPKFVAHIIFITVGTFIIARGGFTSQELGFVVLAIALLTSVFIALSGFGNYRNYRNEIAAKEVTKKVAVKDTLEAPTSDEITPPVVKKPKKEKNKEDQLNA